MRGALCLLLTGCAAAQVATPKPVTTQPAPGVYRVYGRPVSDGCSGELHLAARTFVVSADFSRAHADVVERDYSGSLEDGQFIAEGIFPERSCPKAELHERWRLAPTEQGLSGELEAFWMLPSDCRTPCRVIFEVVLVPEQLPVTL